MRGVEHRFIVRSAVQAAGDLLARVDANSTNHGRGLRGEVFRAAP
jgi:hypothetical protein